MRASHTTFAGALAGLAFAAGGALAEARAPAPHPTGMFGFHGPAHGRFEPFHRQFGRLDHDRIGKRSGFGNFGFGNFGLAGYGYDGGYGYGYQPAIGAGETAPVFVSIYTAPNFYAPPDPALAYDLPPLQGPRIIEVGRRAPRRVTRPIVVYGDAP